MRIIALAFLLTKVFAGGPSKAAATTAAEETVKVTGSSLTHTQAKALDPLIAGYKTHVAGEATALAQTLTQNQAKRTAAADAITSNEKIINEHKALLSVEQIPYNEKTRIQQAVTTLESNNNVHKKTIEQIDDYARTGHPEALKYTNLKAVGADLTAGQVEKMKQNFITRNKWKLAGGALLGAGLLGTGILTVHGNGNAYANTGLSGYGSGYGTGYGSYGGYGAGYSGYGSGYGGYGAGYSGYGSGYGGYGAGYGGYGYY